MSIVYETGEHCLTRESTVFLFLPLQHFSQVTHQVDLPAVCSQFQRVRYLEGIVELCSCAAQHRDPQGLALHYYKSGQPQDDVVGMAAFLERFVERLF